MFTNKIDKDQIELLMNKEFLYGGIVSPEISFILSSDFNLYFLVLPVVGSTIFTLPFKILSAKFNGDTVNLILEIKTQVFDFYCKEDIHVLEYPKEGDTYGLFRLFSYYISG